MKISSAKLMFFLSVVLVLLLSSVSFAAEDYETLVSQGKDLIVKGDYDGAEAVLRNALELQPEGREALLNLGISLRRQGKSKEAESFLKRALAQDPSDPVANLELGMLYEDKEVYTEAIDFYENVLDLVPDTDYGKAADKLLKALIEEEERKKAKRWAVGVSAGAQYDSNVVLAGNDNTLPEGVTDEADWRAVLTAAGTYDLVRAGKFNLSTAYSFYQSLHDELSAYDVQAHSARVAASYDFLTNFRFRTAYTFNYVLLDNEDYSSSHSIAPAILVADSKGRIAMLEYKFTDMAFEDSDILEDNSDRDAQTSEVSFIYTIPAGQYLNFRLGAGAEFSSAEVDIYSYDGYKGTLGVVIDLPLDIKADLEAEYLTKEYDGDNDNVIGGTREEDTQKYSLALSKQLLPWLSLGVTQVFVINDANGIDGLYEYDRSVTGTTLTARF